MDATLRVAMRLKGQANYREPRASRESYPVKDDQALRRVLTVRGRTGAVLLTDLARSEAAADIAEVFLKAVPKQVLEQVEGVASDQPSSVLFEELRVVCPRMQCLYLDSVHIVIAYNTSFWHKSTPGQVVLRRMQAKFQKVDPTSAGGKEDWGAYYTGATPARLSSSEEMLRAMILSGDMAKARAVAVLNGLDDSRPWYARRDYIEAMAALSAAYPAEMQRKTYMQSRLIGQVLHAYTAPEKLEWLWNGLRMRHSMPSSMLSLLGSGTSPNEALHSEINRWFRNQPEVFPSTLALQLQIGRLGKLLAHNAAMYRPTFRQCEHSVVLAASTAGLVLNKESWMQGNAKGLAFSVAKPLTWKRKALQARIRAANFKKTRVERLHVVLKRPARRCVFKRPASIAVPECVAVLKRPAASDARPIKRTPFCLQRRHQ